MSFDKLKKDELLEAAEIFGTEVKPTDTKDNIVAALVEDGVEYDTYVKFKKDAEEVDAPADESDDAKDEEKTEAPVAEEEESVLVKMTRKNGTFEIRGYRFTRTHPYAIVKESDADYLIEEIGGFQIATPKEAREFYN